MIVGVTPATMDPPLIKEVKKEVPSLPPSPNRGAGLKEVSEDGSSSQKTPEEENVVGEVPAAEKPDEAELADKEGEGSSLTHSTRQKKQVVARATENTNTDTEKVTLPEKSTEGEASKGKKSKKTLGAHVSKRVTRSYKTK